MSTSITRIPTVIYAGGRRKRWQPSLGCFIGNHAAAAAKAKELRVVHPSNVKPWPTVRRFGGHVCVYFP